MMKSVLVVEDETALRTAMVRALSKIEDIQVVEAGTIARALDLLESAKPAIVFSDLDLPDGSGVEILNAMDRAGIRGSMIFISAYLDLYRHMIPSRIDVEVFAKPIELERLRMIVKERLSRPPSEPKVPNDEYIRLAHYIELACMGQRAVLIKLEDQLEAGEVIGQVVVRAGEIWSAADPQGVGEEALERLMSAYGQVSCEMLQTEAAERNVPSRVAGLTPVAPLAKAPEPAGGAETFDLAFERGVQATLDKDYALAFEEFTKANALKPGDVRVETNLARLRRMRSG
jgi:CheY-like chemotaxis protein